MDDQSLFIHKLRELRSLLQASSEYDRLKISAVLRHLLLDEQPLLHAANREIKWKVRFTVGCVGTVDYYGSIFPTKPTLFTVEDALDPETSPRKDRWADLNLDQFLGLKVAIAIGNEYTVSDVIDFGANAAGGVHHTPKGPGPKKMRDASDLFHVGGMPLFIRLLCAVGRVTEKALRPIEMLSLRAHAEELVRSKHFEAAEKIWRDALQLCETTYGQQHEEVAYVLHQLALTVHHQGKYRDAEMLDNSAHDILNRKYGEEHQFTLSSKYNLSIDLEKQGKLEEAVILLQKGFEVSQKMSGWGGSTKIYIERLIRNLRQLKRDDEAAAFERKSSMAQAQKQ